MNTSGSLMCLCVDIGAAFLQWGLPLGVQVNVAAKGIVCKCLAEPSQLAVAVMPPQKCFLLHIDFSMHPAQPNFDSFCCGNMIPTSSHAQASASLPQLQSSVKPATQLTKARAHILALLEG